MPATPTYVALAEVTLAAAVASVTIPVPSGFRDLILQFDGTGSSAAYVRFRFNSDTGSNYSYITMGGYSGGAFSGSGSPVDFIQTTYSEAGQRLTGSMQLMDYSATDKHKTSLTRNSGYDGGLSTWAVASRWANTAAITSITFYRSAGDWDAGTTINLYGIEA